MRGSAAGAAYAVLLALVVTGCGHSAVPATDHLLRPEAGPAGPPTPLTAVQAPLPLTPDQEVARVGLRSPEIPSAQQVRWPAGGRGTGGPTLAGCAATSSSDGLRVARRTVASGVPHRPVQYADRTVAYDSAASAHLALAQVRRAAATCAVSAPQVTRSPARLPVAASYLLRFQVAGPRPARHVVLVAQQRGDVVDLLTVSSPWRVTPRQERLLLREAVATGTRLARLPLASAGT